MKSFQILAIACGVLAASIAQAQRPKSASQLVPPNLRPPVGMCRVWVDGVPPARQPAPTDCASALRNRPSKGRVIFGDDFAAPESGDRRADDQAADSPLKGLAPMPKGLEPKASDGKPGARKPDEARKKGDVRKADGRKPDSTQVQLDPSVTVPIPPAVIRSPALS